MGKNLRLGATALVLAALSLSGAMAADAAPRDDISDFGESTSPSAHASDSDVSTLKRLQELRNTQSPEEIDGLLALGAEGWDVSALDVGGQTVAAFAEEKPLSILSIRQLGPGCSTTSMCVHANRPHGLIGEGALNISIPGTRKMFAGSLASAVFVGDEIHDASVGVTLYFDSRLDVTAVSRTKA